MRADRLLSILLLLQTHDRLSAAELARRLEVSRRTIYRDMEALSAAGIPVVADRGQGGGWYLLDSYRTRLNGLKPEEVQALFLATPEHWLADLGLHSAAREALLKLLAAVPAQQRQDAEHIRVRFHIDPSHWRGGADGEDLAALPALQAAALADERVRVRYERRDGAQVERVLDPLGLVAKGTIWYLVARAGADLRTYRVSRIREVALTGQVFQRPADFSLAEYWQQSTAQFVARLPAYPAVLRVAPGTAATIRDTARWARIQQVEPPDAEGWQRVHVQFEVIEEAVAFVLGLGPQAEVIEPAELRAGVIAQARQLLERYGAALPEPEEEGGG